MDISLEVNHYLFVYASVLESTVRELILALYAQVLLQILVGWHYHGRGAIGAKDNRHPAK
jgi:hypothetical protein